MSSATSNRYKALLSLCYREGIRNGKVTINPARLVRQRKEPRGRSRFLSREEYNNLIAVLQEKYPEHVSEVIISVNTGMRLNEQFSTNWGQVHLDRKTIELTFTKNDSPRTVRLNPDAIAALKIIQPRKHKSSDRVFPRDTKLADIRPWFYPACTEAGIVGYVWHCNRHTFCSWLAMARATTKEIQEAAGHKMIVTAARYSHLSPQHTQSVVDRISSTASLKHKILKAIKTATNMK